MKSRALLLTFVFTACGGDEKPPEGGNLPSNSAFELVGVWGSNFGTTLAITETMWGAQSIVAFDNDANFAITQNPADDPWNPSKFSKLVWTEPSGGTLHYCSVDFGKDTAEAAMATTNTADPANPGASGCGGFAWTMLVPGIEIGGNWADNYGGTPSVSHTAWGTQTVVEFDNAANSAVTQNASDDMWNPSKFNKVVWTEPTNGAFYVCTVDFGKDTAADAKASTNSADDTDPGKSGCGGMFPWTRYFVPLEIVGPWWTSFGFGETVTSTAWNAQSIISFDNDKNVAITQNADDDMWNPSKFNKVVWTEMRDGTFFYCTVDFGKDTAAEAEASTNTADDTDPGNSGCGGMFAWTQMLPPIEIMGTWTSNFGSTERITVDRFIGYSTQAIIDFDNTMNFMVTQSPPDDAFTPDKFSKTVWTDLENDSFFYCTVAFGLDTAEQAKTSTQTADASNPETSGCGGTFPWTKLTLAQ